ncbi:hypothetical protein HanPSC8_Chr08g0318381 [Helianthus annuus]|nr:hypothetical protein HanPSC8_Chr08g0318381 [Helianthus annuus]
MTSSTFIKYSSVDSFVDFSVGRDISLEFVTKPDRARRHTNSSVPSQNSLRNMNFFAS